MIKLKKQKGFSLLELILVLGLSSLAFVSLLEWEVKKVDMKKAEIAGDEFQEVGKALTSYIVREQINLAYKIPQGTSTAIPLTVLQGVDATVGGVVFPGHKFLPTNFRSTNAFGTTYQIQLRHAAGGVVDGIVLSSAPICEKGQATNCPSAGNPVKYDWIGAAMRKMGANSGMIRSNTLLGFNAGWTLSAADFSILSNIDGFVGYRVSPVDTTIYDQQYLRLDGVNAMLGDLNMANYSIDNATNITYTGWLQGQSILANTVKSANIYNTGDIQTTNSYINGVLKVGTAPLPTVLTAGGPGQDAIEPGDIIADKHLYAQDIYLGNDINNANRTRTEAGHGTNRVIPNVWLSDLLPKYSSRGVFQVTDEYDLTKPVCNGGGLPKVQIIPQAQYTHSRVYGEEYLWQDYNSISSAYTGGGYNTYNFHLEWDLVDSGPRLIWAEDQGLTWKIKMKTSDYNGYLINGKNPGGGFNPYNLSMPTISPVIGLAHVYCDYNF